MGTVNYEIKEKCSVAYFDPIFFCAFTLDGTSICIKIMLAMHMVIFFLMKKPPFLASQQLSNQWAERRPGSYLPETRVTPTTDTVTLILPQVSGQSQGRNGSLFGNLNEHQKNNQILVSPVPLSQTIDSFVSCLPSPMPFDRAWQA